MVCNAEVLEKVGKDKHGVVTRETLTKNWTDWVDNWTIG